MNFVIEMYKKIRNNDSEFIFFDGNKETLISIENVYNQGFRFLKFHYFDTHEEALNFYYEEALNFYYEQLSRINARNEG